MHQHKVIFLCLLLLLLATAASAKIVFSSERDGVKSIYLMDDDGSNQTLLTESEKLKPALPCWSPDGQQILFRRLIRDTFREDGVWRAIESDVFFLMNTDGTNVRQLTENDGSSIGRTSFSLDGKSIVFNRSFRKNNALKVGIYVLNIRMLKMEEIHQSQIRPNSCDWSPDGKQILFAEGINIGGGGGTIWIIGAEGQNPRRLIPAPILQADNFVIHREKPRWSPDGKQIVFTEMTHKWEFVPNVGNARFFGAFRYLICDHNGENIKQLRIPQDWQCYGIDWMDEGKSVVFSARAGIPLNEPLRGDIDIPPCYVYKYHIPTGEITQLTNDPGWDQTIDWISDDVLPVTPQGKKKVTWGEIKQ